MSSSVQTPSSVLSSLIRRLKYRTSVFVSYSRLDIEEAKTVMAILKQSPHEINVWYDQNLKPGSQWRPEIFQSIDESDVLLFLISRNSLSSLFCHLELSYASVQGKRILPLYIENIIDQDLEQELRAEWETRDWDGLADANWATLKAIQAQTLPAHIPDKVEDAEIKTWLHSRPQQLDFVTTLWQTLESLGQDKRRGIQRRRLVALISLVVLIVAVVFLSHFVQIARIDQDTLNSQFVAESAAYQSNQGDIEKSHNYLNTALASYTAFVPGFDNILRRVFPVMADYHLNEGVNDLTIVPTTSYVLAGGVDGKVYLWNWEACSVDQEPFSVISSARNSRIDSVAASPDGRILAAIATDIDTIDTPAANIYRWQTAQLVRGENTRSELLPADGLEVASIAFDDRIEAHMLAVGGNQSQGGQAAIRLYDTQTWAVRQSLVWPENIGQDATIVSLAYGPQGQLTAILEEEIGDNYVQHIAYWGTTDTDQAPQLMQMEPDELSRLGGFAAVAVGDQLVVGQTSEGYLCPWEPSSGAFNAEASCFGRLEGQPLSFGVALSDDGQHILSTGYNGGEVNIWNIDDTENPVATLSGPVGQINGLDVRGGQLVTGLDDLSRTMRLWDWRAALKIRDMTSQELREAFLNLPVASRRTCGR
jgi:WD40 repeat protein